MVRLCTLFLVLSGATVSAQQFSFSLGVNTGITSTYSINDGVSRDPRYKPYYSVKFAPIGVNFSVNYENIGFDFSPSLINIGQNAYVINTLGGQDGKRESDLKYLNLPVAFKVHIIKLSFLKISALASLSAAYLVDGLETVSHKETKLYFPESVFPILPPDYIVTYDGVAVPAVHDYVISEKNDFRSLQVFAAAGFQSDWDISNHWRVVADLRINYGLFDPRTDEYLARLNANETLYDLPGARHDMFGQFTIGIARYIDIERSDQERKKKLKGDPKQYKPKKYPYRKPRGGKPKG